MINRPMSPSQPPLPPAEPPAMPAAPAAPTRPAPAACAPPGPAVEAPCIAYPDWLPGLQRPGSCLGYSGAPHLLHTHISLLLLAGERVFKLKKPVHHDFVDFSSAAARRDACENELRLNRRTAPRLYQGLAELRLSPQGPVMVPVDLPPARRAECQAWPLLEHAVQMRRFDERQRLDHLAAAGRLTPAMVDALADALARFHAALEPAPPGWGSSATLCHWADSNLQALQALLPHDDPLQVLAQRLADWTERRGAALAPLMRWRERSGHVREVHGDLHLANIVWDGAAPLIYDALEFNDSLRHTDTLGDLAFVFMDLLAQGQRALAWRLLSAVLEAAGDQAALPLLRWWAVYRAAVRAKVALLTAPASPDAARYLRLALALAASEPGESALARGLPLAAQGGDAALPPISDTPLRLVLTCGLSGSGKSTVARLLAQRLGGLRLRSDVERKRLYGLAPDAQPAPSVGLYDAEATRRTYERLGELAAALLQAGVPVVVDAAALRRHERLALQALAQRHGARYTLLCCQADPALLARRLTQRRAAGGDPSDATVELLAQQQAWAEWPAEDEAASRLTLDTGCSADALAARCEALVWPD